VGAPRGGLRLPPPLEPGQLVAVVAPSSPFEAALGWRGLGFLAERYRLRYERGIFSRRGYLAGSDERRERELREALLDPEVRAIVAARGGYGATRYAHRLPWRALAEHPKWIVGFSDVTALHVEAQAVGVASMHAPHLTALGRSDAATRASFVDALESPMRERVHASLATLVPGRAVGPIVGGNLTLLATCAAAGRLRIPDGAVLFLEDVTERPYRIDRCIAALAAGGYLDGVSGVALGGFTACDPGPDGVTVDQVLGELLGRLDVPVVRGLTVGHDRLNEPLLLGGLAELDAAPGGATLRVRAARAEP
jgi:muramoyltetrapeptide carboxypeptidase